MKKVLMVFLSLVVLSYMACAPVQEPKTKSKGTTYNTNSNDRYALNGTGVKSSNSGFTATGFVRAHRGNAPYGSEQAEFGVIRNGYNNADVHVKFKNESDKTIIHFENGNWKCTFNCREIRFDRPEQDTWRVTVNDNHTYLIPDAVIAGG